MVFVCYCVKDQKLLHFLFIFSKPNLVILIFGFRKKLSNFSQNQDWGRDSNNYVAKCYMGQDVSRDNYFEDVKLQMDAKLWGEEYNRHNPPKKVDIFMMTVLEMVNR